MTKEKAEQGEQDSGVQVSNLEDLIAYQDDSVVSRTLLKKGGGSVTVFAFDGGQSLSEHTTPYDALVCVLDGKVEVIISGKPYGLNAGQMIIMPADEPHAVRAVTRFKMLLTMLKS